jgi:hypothetical protein
MTAPANVPDDPKARVFLSCGQKNKGERETAAALKDMLEGDGFGFKVYIADDEITPHGVKEAVFQELESSEYFLFVDFPREKLGKGGHRGSLFANQELALAIFLGLPYLGFRQRGVRPRDGLLKFVQAAFPEFETHVQLIRKVREQVRKHKWATGWRNELRMRRREGEWDDAGQIIGRDPTGRFIQRMARYFHVDVQNLHNRKPALGCVANVERIRNRDTGAEISFRPSEVKWAGIGAPAVSIRPGRTRELDAFFVYHDEPGKIWFPTHSDSTFFLPPIDGVKHLEVEYQVSSETMSPARITLRVTAGQTVNDVRVTEVRSKTA